MIGRPVQAVSEILNGRKQIVPETALAFGEALGTSAELWVPRWCDGATWWPLTQDATWGAARDVPICVPATPRRAVILR